MKQYLYIIPFCLLFLACGKDEPATPDNNDIPTPPAGTKALYILNEGLFNMNNCTLSYCNFENQVLDQNYFHTVNRRNLGDTGNDMQQYGSKIYCIVNVSSQVEVIDAASGRSLRQIPLFNNNVARQPRHITFWEGKAYVCSFDGTVARIDTATLSVEVFAQAGRNPDGICATNGKLYVSNSGGLDEPNYDNTVSVIDVASFTEVKKIVVDANPYTIESDAYGDVYVVTRGNYGGKNYNMHRINSATDELVQTLNIAALNFCISGDYAYIYSYSFSQGTSWVKLFNVKTEQVERDNFITDGTPLQTPFGINADKHNGYVYITDTDGDYTSTGEVLCFSPEGVLQFRLTAGLNPHNIVIIH